MEFEAILETFKDHAIGYGPHVKIPVEVYQNMLESSKDKRVICTINTTVILHSALLQKSGMYFILLNQPLVKKQKWNIGDRLMIHLAPDDSTYGMPISEEFQEVLASDPEGSDWFHELTPGKQRSLLHIINKIKSSQLKIERSFVILEHLKRHQGMVDYQILNQDIKAFREKMKF
ncbi:YdeI/OmpD-associated family protein [Flavobacterium sp.]|jgi:hypothetical protein|uniref:YdeI/OmpD-associated family protein n=1 Tax=Flavobacterium sp. TaxID=239 RepID=UPI0022BC6A23|nr:YdeI/OmpD-associated family protein [Flavobacterium sp.]MCZ8144461.1 YdeI/OmpD-associated family protein [Flavobacterium sp.]MCZ8365839.1 YdeI/OmpD-associated family protein [Flavobacterium sp.]